MKILITGCAGFIGFHLVNKLLDDKKNFIYGIDNLNNYYDRNLNRLKILKKNNHFNFNKLDICNKAKLNNFFNSNKVDCVIHLAAQAGVRYSIDNPESYFSNNIEGFFNILDISRIFKIKHLVFASTSSVYGNTKKFPLKETDNTDKPLSFYAASKKTNEVMAYSYSNIYKLPITALRFFTVYGPFGRPDMALFKFAKSIISNTKINLFNKGNHFRDFTYIDDIVSGIQKVISKPSQKKIPYSVFNIGSGKPQSLKLFLSIIEKQLSKKSKKVLLPLQKGDVYKTSADISSLKRKFNFNPKYNIYIGIENFIKWYKGYYNK